MTTDEWLKKLCPDLTDEEREQASEKLGEYVKIALRIFERIEAEEGALLEDIKEADAD